MAMTLAACTGDTDCVGIVNGENQMFVGDEQTLTAAVNRFFDRQLWLLAILIATVDKRFGRALKPGTVYIEAEAKADSNVTKRFKVKLLIDLHKLWLLLKIQWDSLRRTNSFCNR